MNMTREVVILIADDDPGHIRLIEKNLQRAGRVPGQCADPGEEQDRQAEEDRDHEGEPSEDEAEHRSPPSWDAGRNHSDTVLSPGRRPGTEPSAGHSSRVTVLNTSSWTGLCWNPCTSGANASEGTGWASGTPGRNSITILLISS